MMNKLVKRIVSGVLLCVMLVGLLAGSVSVMPD